MGHRIARRTTRRTHALAAATLLALGACATETDSGADPATASGASTTAAPASPPSTTSTTSSTTSSVAASTTTSSTSTTTTTVAPVGGFACVPGDQRPTIWDTRPAADIPPPPIPDGWSTAVVGRSVQGRDIEAFVHVVVEPRRRVVVIGGIHGNEPVTPPAVRGLLDAGIPDDVEVWLVPLANPDGSAAGLRCNANAVDLNRNFAWGWRPDDGGPEPMSEPETRALAAVVESVEPDLVVWVHQPLGYVSAIGATDSALEEAWAHAAGLPVRPDVVQRGGGETWTAFAAGFPSMLIEIDGWAATPQIVAAQRAAFEATLRALP